MSGSKALLATRNSKQTSTTTRKAATRTTTNLFSVLEVERTPEDAQLLKLPRELRDEILEYALGPPAYNDHGWEAEVHDTLTVVIDGRIAHPPAKMMQQRVIRERLSWHIVPMWQPLEGSVSLLLVNKQLRNEFLDVTSRLVLYQLHMDVLENIMYQEPRLCNDLMLHSFAKFARRLYIKSDSYLQDQLHKGEPNPDKGVVGSQGLIQHSLTNLVKCLQSCTALKKLAIDMCTTHRPKYWKVMYLKPVYVQETVLEVVESLPMVDEYSVRTSGASYAKRRTDQDWADAGVFREHSVQFDCTMWPPSDSRWPGAEWMRFLEDIGADAKQIGFAPGWRQRHY